MTTRARSKTEKSLLSAKSKTRRRWRTSTARLGSHVKTGDMMADNGKFHKIVTSLVENYQPGLQLKPKQREVFQSLWSQQPDMVVSLPTGYGNSLIFHLCGRLLKEKHKMTTAVTVVVTPLNIIKKDQMGTLIKKNITCCKLDIKGKGSLLSDVPESGYDFGYEMECKTLASFEDIVAGKFEIIIAHLEALLCTSVGRKLLDGDEFTRKVVALVIDECHTVEQW